MSPPTRVTNASSRLVMYLGMHGHEEASTVALLPGDAPAPMSVRALGGEPPARPARRRSRRRGWLTVPEAEAALAADPLLLSVEDQVKLLRRVNLCGNSGALADLTRRLVWRNTDHRIWQAPLVGRRRSVRHTISYIMMLYKWSWVFAPQTAWLLTEIGAFIPRLSAQQWSRFDWTELALLQRCVELVANLWPAPTSIAVITELHHASVSDRHRRRNGGSCPHRWFWTKANLEDWLRRHPDVPLPAKLVANMLGAPVPEIRAWAFESLLPRVECDGAVRLKDD